MAQDSDSFLKEIAKNETIQKLSTRMGVSRPTFYKYMNMYISGNKAEIPEEYRSFFDSLVYPELNGNITTYEDSLKIEYNEKCSEFDNLSIKLEKMKKELDESRMELKYINGNSEKQIDRKMHLTRVINNLPEDIIN